MTEKAMEPFGLAFEEYYEGNKQAKVVFHRDDGLIEDYHVKHCFRELKDFSQLEKVAIDSCKGRILDIGAGVGPHSLELQRRGFDTCAIDISSHACEIMKKRGVKHVRNSNVYDLKEGTFDTILLMGRAIGFVENLDGLKRFLKHCEALLNTNGRILFDSLDIRFTSDRKHLSYQDKNRRMGRYIGEIRLHMENKGKHGEEFQLLHVDPDTLKICAQQTGWSRKILFEEEFGSYLAKIYK